MKLGIRKEGFGCPSLRDWKNRKISNILTYTVYHVRQINLKNKFVGILYSYTARTGKKKKLLHLPNEIPTFVTWITDLKVTVFGPVNFSPDPANQNFNKPGSGLLGIDIIWSHLDSV